jgi:hypothetical protein
LGQRLVGLHREKGAALDAQYVCNFHVCSPERFSERPKGCLVSLPI